MGAAVTLQSLGDGTQALAKQGKCMVRQGNAEDDIERPRLCQGASLATHLPLPHLRWEPLGLMLRCVPQAGLVLLYL